MPENSGLGEQALNKVAEIGLSSQLDEVEDLNVDIKTNPFKAIQGEVESVDIDGDGLVMEKDLRMEELDMHIENVAINPMSAAFGKIELTKPTLGSARVVLLEEDINRAFNSEYVQQQLQSQKININGRPTNILPQKVDFRLPGDNKIQLNATVLLKETGETNQVAFSAVPRVSAGGKTVTLENVEYDKNQENSSELAEALINQTSELLNLSNFDLEGMDLTVKSLEVETGKLVLLAEAYVEKIPTE
ncbi:DUF2993 domain-containing protein [Plectonema cf. radiosum LEGE 06105]|uniref:DUF2993 domain-containing protein n=1 Tax=Plectonema cf. radiosum LEGE 06105 TaxID=945769 RepID=A0A8J7JRQ9_9CYAN|nr:DUF2993 domain-containing protein [Plectonema radiosum]MBE9211604.1 DUF2993 domain-containing protein [Plectonema cf. radiosum LEGE 06105]